MFGSADDRAGDVRARALGSPATLLMVILVLLALTACRDPDSPASSGNVPASPGNVLYAQEGSTVRLSWDAASRADYYQVLHDDFFGDNCRLEAGRAAFCDVLDARVTETTFVDACPSVGQENYYWVVACNGRGCSEIDSDNPVVAFVAEAGNAGPPSTLAAAIALDSVSEVQRLVDAGADVNGTDCSGDPVLFAAIRGGNTEIVRVLLDAGAHVRSSREALLYAHSEEMQRILLDAGAIPPFPPLVQVVDRSEGSLTIMVEGVATYYSFRRRSETRSGEWVDLPPHNAGLNFHDTGLAPGATFYYTAQSCSSGGCSDASDATGGVTEAAGQVDPPSSPASVRGHKFDVALDTDDAGVSWKPVEGATYYEIYQGSPSGTEARASFDAEVSAPQTSYRDYSPNSSFGAFYATSYSVKACNKAGCSPLSEVVVVR
ncbi:MAG: ankyrin repeat domain-containing protein [Chloroflexota bacterium]|nr:ankyrin repeat domain-containing protein [Chloroflexota bacterium]